MDKSFFGKRVRTTYQHSELGTIVKPRKSQLPAPGDGWYVIRFDDGGGQLYIHRSMFNFANG